MITEQEHSSELWRVQDDGPDGCIYITGETIEEGDICDFYHMGGDQQVVFRKYRCVANAARTVKCVNACKGINPEAVPEMLVAMKQVLRNCHCEEASCGICSVLEPVIAKATEEVA